VALGAASIFLTGFPIYFLPVIFYPGTFVAAVGVFFGGLMAARSEYFAVYFNIDDE
jgi:hypothetical protein